VVPSGATTTPNIISISGNKSANGNGATENCGTTKGGGVRTSISMQGPLLAFNPVVGFLCELQQNYRGVKIEKLQNL
jgi:hypothetical protein